MKTLLKFSLKKIALVFIVLMLSFSFAACDFFGPSSGSELGSGSGSKPTKPPVYEQPSNSSSFITGIIGAYVPDEIKQSDIELRAADFRKVAEFIAEKLASIYINTANAEIKTIDKEINEQPYVLTETIYSPNSFDPVPAASWNVKTEAEIKTALETKIAEITAISFKFGLFQMEVDEIKEYVLNDIIGTENVENDQARLKDSETAILTDISISVETASEEIGGEIVITAADRFFIDTNLDGVDDAGGTIEIFNEDDIDDDTWLNFCNYKGVVENIFTALSNKLKTIWLEGVGAAGQKTNESDLLVRPMIEVEYFEVERTESTDPDSGTPVHYAKILNEKGEDLGTNLPMKNWVALAFETGNAEERENVSAYFCGASMLIKSETSDNFDYSFNFVYNSFEVNMPYGDEFYGGELVKYVNLDPAYSEEEIEAETDDALKDAMLEANAEIEAKNNEYKNNNQLVIDLTHLNENLPENKQYPQLKTGITTLSANKEALIPSIKMHVITEGILSGAFLLEATGQNINEVLMVTFTSNAGGYKKFEIIDVLEVTFSEGHPQELLDILPK